MRKRHTLGATLRGHWSLWVHSPRTVIALAFVAMMTIMFTRAQHLLYEASGYALHLGEMVYASVNQGFHLLNTSIGFLVMISPIARAVADFAGGVLRDDLVAVSGGDAAFGHPLLSALRRAGRGMERPRAAGRRSGLCV